ncbi:hypothetical protein NTGHW29_640012 [Candidatus Nitrotoga sp. HW29]|nr:hypothetical protein NTGHW29_640012 [Candidatus Nitrotoga sp. HW29]
MLKLQPSFGVLQRLEKIFLTYYIDHPATLFTLNSVFMSGSVLMGLHGSISIQLYLMKGFES